MLSHEQLLDALKKGNLDILKQHQDNIDILNDEFLENIIKNNHLHIIKYILDYKIEDTHKSRVSSYYLYNYALEYNKPDIIKLLQKYKMPMSINERFVRSNVISTHLEKSNGEYLDLLLETATNDDLNKNIPLPLYIELSKTVPNKIIIEKLLKHGANPNIVVSNEMTNYIHMRNIIGHNAIMYTISHNLNDIMNLLLDYGADTTKKIDSIKYAIFHRNSNAIISLLSHGVPILDKHKDDLLDKLPELYNTIYNQPQTLYDQIGKQLILGTIDLTDIETYLSTYGESALAQLYNGSYSSQPLRSLVQSFLTNLFNKTQTKKK